MKFIYKFIKKNKIIYNLLTIILKYTVYRGLFFRSYQEDKTNILNTKFYYPRNSIVYRKFFKGFDLNYKKKLDVQYNILNTKYNFDNIDCIIDVGSNLGYQSLYYNEKFKKIIICFEPSSLNFFFLKKNLKNFKNITLYNYALGEQKKTLNLSIPIFEKHRPSNLGLFTLRAESQSSLLHEKVKVEKFDNLKTTFKDYKNYYIKIDVEGYEYEVLTGMQNLINKKNCVFKIELNWNYFDVQRLKNIYKFLKSKDYQVFLFDYETKSLNEVTESQLISLLKNETYDVVFARN